jgi:alkylation response protein AidB-like acyl-CoA dehydrogenase
VDFEFTEEQIMLRENIREFAEGEIGPKVMDYDEKQEFPHDLVKQAGELGLMGIIFPEKYGGAGMGYVEYVTAIEEISRVDGSMGLTIAAHNSLCSNHLYQFGSEEQKQKYLVPLAKGEWIGAWALTEATAGSDAGGTKTVAVTDGNDWVLNGNKTFITHGTVGHVAIIFAVTDKGKGHKGISSFVVEQGTAGYRPGKKEDKMGLRASETSEIIMEDCRIPADQLIGEQGQGFIQAMKILDGGRISIAALALGMARGAYEAALKYSKEREQFNRSISSFQAIQFMLADMATKIEAASLLTYRSAWMMDHGMKVTKESAMAKLYAGEIGCQVTDTALQIFGGYGLVKDFPAEKFYRDIKLCTIGEGTSEIQRLVIARELMKRL